MRPESASGLPFLALHARASSEQLFRQLLESAPDGVVITDGQGRIVFVNGRAEQMFDYPPGSLLGEPLEVLLPDRLKATHVRQHASYAATPRLRPMGSGLDLLGRKRSGAEFPIEISLSPLATDHGMLFSANVRDISQRRQAEAATRRVQAHLLSAVESIQGAFAIFDSRDSLVLCNSEYRQLIAEGISGEAIGRSFSELLGALERTLESDEPTPSSLTQRWSEYHRAPRDALRVRTRDGRHLRVIERRTAEGGSVTTLTDVTDDVAREEQLQKAQALAEAASSAKSEFLASMSHELRTPLNAVLGFAQLLQRDKKSPLSSRQQQRIQQVLQGGEHLLRLIDDVLDLARIEAGRVLVSPERVDVAEVLSEIEATLQPMAARAEMHITREQVLPDAAHVVADRTRLKQVLMNFGSNAIKYGRPQGKVRLRAIAQDGRTRILVEDDGIGIAVDKQSALFQPFQRAGQETGPIEGTGIGLVISKRLAELMEGRVGFESSEGQGSTFWIELPQPVGVPARPVPAEALRSAARLGGAEGPRYFVIYIEDNPSNIAFMRDLLSDFERVELVTAPTAEIGIELARARKPDVVIMDINLPGMSGIEASALLKTWPETRAIPIIALTAATLLLDPARVKAAGFHRYLTKPVKVDELAATLEELLLPGPPKG